MPNIDPLTTAEVADRLGCDTRTVARHVERGNLTPAMKLPGLRGAYLFDPAEVDRFCQVGGGVTAGPHAHGQRTRGSRAS